MAQQHEAAVIGMWVFLLTEMLFFGGLFIAYMVYRIWYFEAFAEASKSLDIFWGAVQHRGADRQLADDGAGGALGADQPAQGHGQLADLDDRPRRVFLGVKVIEYADKFEHHHVPGSDFVWAANTTRPGGRRTTRRRHAAAAQRRRAGGHRR